MGERRICDQDYTILRPNWTELHQYFIDIFGEVEGKNFSNNMSKILWGYETTVGKYNYELLAHYLSNNTNLSFTAKNIQEWDDLVRNMKDTVEPFARDFLEYNKRTGKSSVILTNWFGDSQRERLKRHDLLKFFDEIYSGDVITKPNREAYIRAAGNYPISNCTIIGDNYKADYAPPRSLGMNAILYDPDDRYPKELVKVKSLSELIK